MNQITIHAKITEINHPLWSSANKVLIAGYIFFACSVFAQSNANNELQISRKEVSSSTENNQQKVSQNMMIRIAEIHIYPEYLSEYIAILKENAEASMRLESGVIAIYPLSQKGNPTQIRILEIYLNQESYESHLQTAHFKQYKSTTLRMVESLKLVDMDALDQASMGEIFKKLK